MEDPQSAGAQQRLRAATVRSPPVGRITCQFHFDEGHLGPARTAQYCAIIQRQVFESGIRSIAGHREALEQQQPFSFGS